MPGVRKIAAEQHNLSVVANGNIDGIRARTKALGAFSVDVQPAGLREVFLECVREDHE